MMQLLWRLYLVMYIIFFFFKQKTAYEMRISDWSSDVCSSDLQLCWRAGRAGKGGFGISPNRGHPLPASPGLRRRRGQSSRLKPLLQQRQLLAQGREREAAVADAVLQRRIEFGRRPAALGIEEHRVVAEPAVAAPRVQDAAVPAAFGDQRLRVFGVAQQHDCGVEVRDRKSTRLNSRP